MNVGVLKPLAREATPRLPLRWGGKAVCAIIDQGCFAGSGFVVNILLARWLSAEAFGSFAVAYSTFFLLGTLYAQVLTAPMLVFGAGKYAEDFRSYVGLLVRGHIIVAGLIGLLLAGTAIVLARVGSPFSAQTFATLAIAVPFILLLWFVRSAFFAALRPHWAAAGSVMNMLLVAGGMFELYRLRLLSSSSAFLVMGASGMIVGSVLLWRLQPRWRPQATALGSIEGSTLDGTQRNDGRGAPTLELATVVRDHGQYAKWSSAAAGTGWLVGNLHYFVLSASAGLTNVAAMRVLDTALSPYFHFQLALSRLLVPVLGARSRHRSNDLFPYVLRITALWGGLALIAYVLVRSFAPQLISLLYGGAYRDSGRLLGWYGLIMIAIALADPMLSFLTALVRTDLVFIYQTVFSGALLIGYLAAGRHGLLGIVAVLIVVNYAMVPLALIAARTAWVARTSSLDSSAV